MKWTWLRAMTMEMPRAPMVTPGQMALMVVTDLLEAEPF